MYVCITAYIKSELFGANSGSLTFRKVPIGGVEVAALLWSSSIAILVV
jgi:hypothetical protein